MSLESMHKDICDMKSQQQKRNQNNQRKKIPVNFSTGDYALWSRVDNKNAVNKLDVIWMGPYQVVSISEYSCFIRHLITEEIKEVHSSRLRMYADKYFNFKEKIVDLIVQQEMFLKVKSLGTI